jgi:hypothetical protein
MRMDVSDLSSQVRGNFGEDADGCFSIAVQGNLHDRCQQQWYYTSR